MSKRTTKRARKPSAGGRGAGAGAQGRRGSKRAKRTLENFEIARLLTELADLLEIQGANPFRVRAYRNAVLTIAGLTRSLADMVAQGEDLTELAGFGSEMARHVTEMVQTGRLQMLDEVHKEVPAGLAELTRLDGLGPKRTKKLWETLGVKTIADLERTLETGRILEVEGFGEKSVERLRRSIADQRKHVGRFRLVDADQLVRPLVDYMRGAEGIEKLEVAGSYRRRRDTIGDIDLLAVCDDAGPVMRHFTAYPGVARVQGSGGTRGTVILKSGLQVDLRIVPRRAYGAALHYFTGSKEHNIAVRTLGVQRGLRISEYGVFRVPKGAKEEDLGPESGERIGGAREEDVFRAVGLKWIPPELRENRGEIEAAQNDRLPDLITLEDIRGDLQMHSTWSDGKNTIEEMARAAAALGYEYIAITDHTPAVGVAGGLKPGDIEEQWEEIGRAQQVVPGITIFRSMEVDILRDGSLDLADEYLERLDLVVVSIHSHMHLGKREMTERILKAVRHPQVDILSHPTGRRINEREPFEMDMEVVLAAAHEQGVAVELNAHPERLDLSDVHVFRARELGLKIAIDTDAHSVDNLRNMSYGIDQARRGWLEAGHVINTLPLQRFRKWLTRRRK
ncbi:MAG: DNA polymerase/3'-5' exonuclease PolX [Gemmatimonadetes bacterium]|nr:DNA polymerase/3'-5' exonuclease PolX [Gemmatimonadota bacterium]